MASPTTVGAGWIATTSATARTAAPASSRQVARRCRRGAVEGCAGGIQPWWHHIGSVHEDRRQYATAEPLFRWHEQNQQYLVDRQPIATVGVLWSQRSVDFHGKDQPESRSLAPYQGF